MTVVYTMLTAIQKCRLNHPHLWLSVFEARQRVTHHHSHTILLESFRSPAFPVVQEAPHFAAPRIEQGGSPPACARERPPVVLHGACQDELLSALCGARDTQKFTVLK